MYSAATSPAALPLTTTTTKPDHRLSYLEQGYPYQRHLTVIYHHYLYERRWSCGASVDAQEEQQSFLSMSHRRSPRNILIQPPRSILQTVRSRIGRGRRLEDGDNFNFDEND